MTGISVVRMHDADAAAPELAAARDGDVTLLDAARDAQHNNAVVLREHLPATLRAG